MKSKLKREQKRQRKRALRQKIDNLRELAREVGLLLVINNTIRPIGECGYYFIVHKNNSYFSYPSLEVIMKGNLNEVEIYLKRYWDMKAFL